MKEKIIIGKIHVYVVLSIAAFHSFIRLSG